MFHFLFIKVYKYYIGSNSNNFTPWDKKFAVLSKQSHIFRRSRNNESGNFATFFIKLNIPDAAEAAAVIFVDDFLIAELRKTHKTSQFSP